MPKRRHRKPDELAQDTTHQRLVAWELYHENLRSGMDETTAINQALRKVLARGTKGSDNRPRELEQWKKYELWPPPEIEEPAEDKSSVSVLKHRDADACQELSEADILTRAKEILMRDIDVAERPTTAKGRPSTLPTTMIAARFPTELVNQLEALGGRKSHHLEKALKLYLKLINEEQDE
jgi:hypothetical protein